MIGGFYFPDLEVQKIYDKNEIIKLFLYLNLIHTDSFSLLFNFVCYDTYVIEEFKARGLIFDILKNSKMFERLNTSHKM